MQFEPQNDPGKAHFQQELNRWFESKGIISDLRSHLRHLMITALQNTQIGLQPTDKTSPKAQALNLMVAEYLFRHGCHYTLSVFTSEVPTLANFSAVNPSAIMTAEKSTEGAKKRAQRHCFQEKEVEEILNALGVNSTFEEVECLKGKYFQKGYESSLWEAFLLVFIELSTKLQIRKTLESYEVDDGRKLLSEKWSVRLVDILLGENVKSSQIPSIEKAVLRITESEIKRLLEEERKMQLRTLAEREKRIQEHLRKHEEEVFVRLIEAEKDLSERKDMIDEELTDRQKHLTKMALEWNERHEEILKLSRNFHNIENENIQLGKRVQELEMENDHLRTQGDQEKKTTEQLQIEIDSLVNKLREVTDSNVSLNERIEVLMRRENKEVSVSHDNAQEDVGINAGQSPKKTNRSPPEIKENIQEGEITQNAAGIHPQMHSLYQFKNRLDSGDGMQIPSIDLSEDESDSSSNSFSDEIITNVRKKLQALEEETNRANKNYFDYKRKCQTVDSDSEISSGVNKSHEKITLLQFDTEIIKESRFCQTISPDVDLENVLVEIQEQNREDIQNLSERSHSSLKKTEMRTPTKRQQQNREFFLKNRQLLREFEKQKVEELNAGSPSLSFQISSSGDSDNCDSVRNSPKEVALLTPLRTASFYCNEESEIKKDEVNKKKEGFNQLDDKSRLALLEEARIKSPQESARKLLRQQILLSEDEDDEKQKEDGSNRTANNGVNTEFWL